MAEVASAYVSVLPSARGFGAKLDSQVSGDVKASGKRLGTSWGKVFGIAAGFGIGAKAISFLGDSLGEAREAQTVGKRTASVIKSMGGAANISASGVANLAGAISKKTGIDDEAIQAGQNMLLTFGNVRNEAGKGNRIFSQASQLMIDMSTAMGTDAKQSAIQLGKALNDPVKGTAALGRVGVQFSEDQKEAIKTMVESGDTLGAQKTILKELEKQFGGAAASMATPADKAEVAWGNLKEQIGTAVLPVVDKATRAFTKDVVPAISTFVTQVQTGEGAGGQFRDAVERVASTVKKAAGFVRDNADAFKTLAVVLGTAYTAFQTFMFIKNVTTAVRAFNAVLRANPIGIVITAIALLATGLVLAYKKSETFRTVVDKAFSVVKSAASGMWDGIKVVFNAMKKGFEAVGKAGTWLWNNALQPAFKFIVNGIASILDLWSSMLGTLAKVPGFGWAKKAADAMAGAADKAREMADGIKKIPDKKNVYVAVKYTYSGLRGPGGAGTTRSGGGSEDFLPRLSDPRGPQRAFNQILKEYGAAGAKLMDRVEAGIKSSKPKAVKAAQEAFDSLKSKIESKRDDVRSVLDGLKEDFAGIRDSVADAFAGGLFDVSATTDDAGNVTKTIGQNFIEGLMGKKAELTGLLASFNTLKGWGIDPKFLTQLFASGQGGLITELAGMGQSGAVSAANLFGEVTALSSQLGTAVASNDPVAAEMQTANATLERIEQALSYLGSDIGKELNQAAAAAKRKKKGGGNR